MPKQTKSIKEKKTDLEATTAEVAEEKRKKRRNAFITASAILCIIGITIGIGYYLIYARDFQRPIIIVNDESVTIDYFIRRTVWDPITDDPYDMLEVLVNELLVKQGAQRAGIIATDEEIDGQLREYARAESETITDAEYREWYRQQLNVSKLSDAEFRDFIRVQILAGKLHTILAEQVPTVADQVHLHMVYLDTYEEAEAIKQRYDQGEDFAALVEEMYPDVEFDGVPGDAGWLPYGVIDTNFRYIVAGLSIGEVSSPVLSVDPVTGDTQNAGYILFMVSEKDESRELEEEDMVALQNTVLEDWLSAEMSMQNIEFHGRNNGYDSETDTWIRWQIQKRKQ